MRKLLKRYLLVTGTLAFVALLAPGLVVLGFYLLLLPGLVLFFAPTAFLWGCLYAMAFRWMQRFAPEPVAAGMAGIVLVALVWMLPQPSLHAARASLDRHSLANVEPVEPIRPAGDVRIDHRFAPWDNRNPPPAGRRVYACDNECIALLFEPGVRSVTVNSTEEPTFEALRDGNFPIQPAARTYRLVARSECHDDDLLPDLAGAVGRFGRTAEDNSAMAVEWKQRLTTEFCLRSESPLPRHDLVLRTGYWWSGASRSGQCWAPWGNDIHADFAEARRGDGELLMRFFHPRVSSLAVPFGMSGVGSDTNYHFCWSRTLLPDRTEISWEVPGKALDASLDVRRTAQPLRAFSELRTSLAAALDDASLPGSATIFDSVGDFMQFLAKNGAGDADRQLVERLISDQRLDDLKGAWALPKIFSADALAVMRARIIAKLAGLPDSVRPDGSQLGAALQQWPPNAFAQLTADEIALLHDVNRRRRANGLVARLWDMGAPAAAMLVRIVEEHSQARDSVRRDDRSLSRLERDYGYAAHGQTFSAAVSALCRLGPDAASELPRLLELEKRSTRKPSSADWDRMMVRVGKPIEQVRKPAEMGGSDESYRSNLRNFLARYDPARGC